MLDFGNRVRHEIEAPASKKRDWQGATEHEKARRHSRCRGGDIVRNGALRR
jgi:hypothetical protein